MEESRGQSHDPRAIVTPGCGLSLITGGGGFVGRRLVHACHQEGRPVRVFGRLEEPSLGFGGAVEVTSGDIRDATALREAVKDVHTIYHLASMVHDTKGTISAEQHWSVTVDGTRTLLEAARHANVRAVIFVSTLAVYGRSSSGVRDESAPCRPTTPYGRSKLEAERLVLAFGKDTQTHVCCLRPASIYGSGCKGNLRRMISLIDRGLFPPPPETGRLRSFVHVDDVIRAMSLAATRPEADGQCFIVTDATPVSTRVLFESICHGLGRRVPGWAIPASLFRIVAVCGDLGRRVAKRPLPFDTHAFEVLLGGAQFDSALIAGALGFRPTKSIFDAVPEMVASHRSFEM